MSDPVKQVLRENMIEFPRTEKLPVDPPIPGQNYGLFSFKLLPKPIDGVFGFLKFRGAFNTTDEYTAHAENIIRTVDSKHRLFPYPQGRWFPLTDDPKWAQGVEEVTEKDTGEKNAFKKNTLSDIYREEDQVQSAKERNRIKEIKEREKILIEESQRGEDTESLHHYANKVMQLEQINTWLVELRKRKRDLTNALSKTSSEVERIKSEHPEYQNQVADEIKRIRQEIGLE